jgi:hypothetical protein
MLTDRIGPTAATAALEPTSSAIPGRVVGLGAPVSVLICLSPREAPLLSAQLLKRRRDEQHEEAVIDEMLASLSCDIDEERIVLWPTAYASPILRAALTDAVAGIAAAVPGDDSLASLADALDTARSVLATLQAFLAVDNGGLDQVAL